MTSTNAADNQHPVSNDATAAAPVSYSYPSLQHRIDSAQAWIKGPNHDALKESEQSVRVGGASRCGVVHHLTLVDTLVLFVVNSYATILVFVLHLITIESMVSIGCSVGFTLHLYFSTTPSSFDGGIMDWILLSFAIVTPMNSSIGFAFKRREEGLNHIAKIRSLVFGIYQAHSTWDWGKSGRAKSPVDWEKHSNAVLQDLLEICDKLCRYLTLPTVGRARHRMTLKGKEHATEAFDVMEELMLVILTKVNHLSLHCEILKHHGMPGNESSRIRQWERDMVQTLEQLQVIKEYRTPQALRSLCRIFSVVLPPLYAPYYVQMARDLNDSLSMAIVFAVLTSLVLTALFESLTQMEDPFVAHVTLDGIDVPKELKEKTRNRLQLQQTHVFFPQAQEGKEEERKSSEDKKASATSSSLPSSADDATKNQETSMLNTKKDATETDTPPVAAAAANLTSSSRSWTHVFSGKY